jgi:hypothetical protein
MVLNVHKLVTSFNEDPLWIFYTDVSLIWLTDKKIILYRLTEPMSV